MAATVRSPGARIAPIKSTLAHSHTRSLKTASKWRNTCIIPFGRVSIFSFSFGRILREAYSVFPFLSSDWIKSSLAIAKVKGFEMASKEQPHCHNCGIILTSLEKYQWRSQSTGGEEMDVEITYGKGTCPGCGAKLLP